MDKYVALTELLTKRFEQEKYRQIRSLLPTGQANRGISVNFSSNDYLGLSDHPSVKKKSIEYVLEWGAGSSATRVLASHIEAQSLLQKRCAEFLKREAALFFPSQHLLLMHLFSSFSHSRAVVFIDSSLNLAYKQAALSAGIQPVLFHHNDLEDLQERLEQVSGPSFCLVITESLSEVEGDVANLSELAKIAERFRAFLCVEETCSFGIYGHQGRGLAANLPGVDLVLGMFNKACGAYGSFLAGKQPLIDLIVHCCDFFSPLSPLPPAALGAIDALIDLIPEMDEKRVSIQESSMQLKEVLSVKGWPVSPFECHLFTLSLPDISFAKMLSKLYESGIFVSTVRPALGRKRIKFAANATHSVDDFEELKRSLITNELRQESTLEPVRP